MSGLCYIDNDVILKLAACDLLDDVLDVIGHERKTVRVIPTAYYKFTNRNEKLIARYGAAALRRAIDFVSGVTAIDVVSVDEHVLLTRIDGIDSGEAVLYSATADQVDFILTTGDKKSLRALARNADCGAIRDRLAGRVICFEQLMLAALDGMDFDIVHGRVAASLEVDSVLKAAFGGDLVSTANAREVLLHYAEHLRSETGALLSPLMLR